MSSKMILTAISTVFVSVLVAPSTVEAQPFQDQAATEIERIGHNAPGQGRGRGMGMGGMGQGHGMGPGRPMDDMMQGTNHLAAPKHGSEFSDPADWQNLGRGPDWGMDDTMIQMEPGAGGHRILDRGPGRGMRHAGSLGQSSECADCADQQGLGWLQYDGTRKGRTMGSGAIRGRAAGHAGGCDSVVSHGQGRRGSGAWQGHGADHARGRGW